MQAGQLGIGSTTAVGSAPDQMGAHLNETDLGPGANVTQLALGVDFSW